MILFQNFGLYPTYRRRLSALTESCRNFADHKTAFLSDRFGASHLLYPVIENDPQAFFTNGDDVRMQALWASENGLSKKTPPEQILLNQIEAHRTEVFYNLDPVRYPSDFIRKLPGCVKTSIAWRAAPSGSADLSAYDLVISNFPSILKTYESKGWKTKYFTPSYDPTLNVFANNKDRPIDVIFSGGYSRHHRKRAKVLEAVAHKCANLNIHFLLDQSRATRFAESPLGWLLPLGKHRRPKAIRSVSEPAAFGVDLYANLSRSKIVLNGAIDMAGDDRGNMRCFEALGSGALLLSDAGKYPEGFVDRETMLTYRTEEEVVDKIQQIMLDSDQREKISASGHKMISTLYSKEKQWERFLELVV